MNGIATCLFDVTRYHHYSPRYIETRSTNLSRVVIMVINVIKVIKVNKVIEVIMIMKITVCTCIFL